jgi:hypothetical protein
VAGTGRLVRIEGKMNGANYREILTDPYLPAPEHSGPQTGEKVHLPTGQQPKHTAKECLRDKSLNVLE